MLFSDFSFRYRATAGALFLIVPCAPGLHAQDLVLDRYYVNAAPAASAGTAAVPSSRIRSYLPVDVGAILSRETTALSAVRRGGVASDVLLRGLGRDNVAVAIDGAPAHAACPGRMDPPVFHVSSVLVERITVSEGPFDVRHGSAPGGTIAVQTAPAPDRPLATVGILGGSAGLRAIDAAAGGPLGERWRWLGAFASQEGRSYCDGNGIRITAAPGLNYRTEVRDARAFSIQHGEAQVRWADASGRQLAFQSAINDGRGVFYPALMMDAQRDRATRLGLHWSAPVALPWAETWHVTAYHHRVEHDMSDALRQSSLGPWATRGWMMRTVAATTDAGLQMETEGRPGTCLLTTGAVLGERRWVADNVIGPNANPMIPDVTISNAAAYVQAEQAGQTWTLRAALRADTWRSRAARNVTFAQEAHGTTRNGQTDFAPTGHVLIERPWPAQQTLFIGLGRGARLPDPQERYTVVDRPGTGTDWVGNPTLGVVEGTEVMAGLRRTTGAVRWSVRAFQLQLAHHVVLDRLTPAAGSTAAPNRTESYLGIDAVVRGAEARTEIDLGRSWTALVDAAGQRGRKQSLPHWDTDRDLADIPPLRSRVALRWQRPDYWVELESQWAARQSHYDAGAGERALPGYGVCHVRAEWQAAPQWTVSIGVENVFNRTYATHNAYTRDPFAAGTVINEPGRSVYAQLRWKK